VSDNLWQIGTVGRVVNESEFALDGKTGFDINPFLSERFEE